MQDIITWLESPEGEAWSRQQHCHDNVFRTFLVKIIGDNGYQEWESFLWVA